METSGDGRAPGEYTRTAPPLQRAPPERGRQIRRSRYIPALRGPTRAARRNSAGPLMEQIIRGAVDRFPKKVSPFALALA